VWCWWMGAWWMGAWWVLVDGGGGCSRGLLLLLGRREFANIQLCKLFVGMSGAILVN